MRAIDELPAANSAPMVDPGVRSRIAAFAILGLGLAMVLAGVVLAGLTLADMLPDRQLTCAALFGASGAFFGVVGIRILRTRAAG